MNDQSSTKNQLQKLIILANQNGLYDAADWVTNMISYYQPEPRYCTDCKCRLADVIGGLEEHKAGCEFFPL